MSDDDRKARLAAQLRANLHRRKAQSRALKQAEGAMDARESATPAHSSDGHADDRAEESGAGGGN